jgi:ABC-type multidrug transport system ATPase subunit
MIDVLNISKSFSHRKVLNDVSFTLRPGTLTGIIGENGSGKSTLLKIIMGELSADHGTVNISGSVGYCPQESLVFPTLSVQENLQYFASAYGLTTTSNKNKLTSSIDGLLKQLGFDAYRNERVQKLSGGTRQKLNLSISLLHDPAICILDEPYGGFDWETYQNFWEVIAQLKNRGKTILLVTHLLNDTNHFDQLLALKQGRLV